MIIQGVNVTAPEGLPQIELVDIVNSEIALWGIRHPGKIIGTIDIKQDGDELAIASNENSPIIRIRRITGYLSNLNNFSPHKQVEAAERVCHGGV